MYWALVGSLLLDLLTTYALNLHVTFVIFTCLAADWLRISPLAFQTIHPILNAQVI